MSKYTNLPDLKAAPPSGNIEVDAFRIGVSVQKSDLQVRGNIQEIAANKFQQHLRNKGYKNCYVTVGAADVVINCDGVHYQGWINPAFKSFMHTYNRYLSGHIYCRNKSGLCIVQFYKMEQTKNKQDETNRTNSSRQATL